MNLRCLYKSALCGACAFFNLKVGLAQQEGYAVLVGVRSTTAVSSKGHPFDNNATAGVAKDLEKIQKLLQAAKFKDPNIKILSSTSDTQASSILENLKSMSTKAKTGDLVVFYFSGHGDTTPDLDNDELSGMDGILVASDRRIVDDLLRPIWNSYQRGVRLVMIVDACHSGESYDFSLLEHQPTEVSASRRRTAIRQADNQRFLAITTLRNLRFSNEIKFNNSRQTFFTSCLQAAQDPAKTYQMIYLGASHTANITGGSTTGSVFTDALYRKARQTDPNQPVRRTYRELMENLDTCPSKLSYAELGLLTQIFRTDYFLKIR
ncbi:caspase family protein [Spirosoma sp. KCTC 42546]|uniref:caspase family protein n=1 Tax=Spirosoma sp. KCTC 42546 TaxID=2520506 RepID=UPI00143D3FDB|nr:caspase family protein [Spirosoma sp. KCTC 42546]